MRAFACGQIESPNVSVSRLRVIFNHGETLAIGRECALAEKTRLTNRPHDRPLAIENCELAQLRRRHGNHELVGVAVHAGGPGPNWSRFRQAEQQRRRSKLEVTDSRHGNGHDSPIGSQECQFLAIAPPERHALSTLVRNLPWACGWRNTRSCGRIEGPHIELISSGLVGDIGRKPVVRRKTRTRNLGLAAIDLDRLPFACSLQR